MTDGQAAQDLNTTYRTGTKEIPSTELLSWAGQNGRYTSLETDASSSSSTTQDISKVALTLIERDGTSLDLSRTDHKNMLDALVSNGVLKDSDRTELESMSSAKISRAQELFGQSVHHLDVAKARAL